MDANPARHSTPPSTSPSTSPSPNPRDIARRRKRQIVGGTLVAFGATCALVLTNPLSVGRASGDSAAAVRPADPDAGRRTGDVLPAPTATPFFGATNGGGDAANPDGPNLRAGSGRGSLRSGGS